MKKAALVFAPLLGVVFACGGTELTTPTSMPFRVFDADADVRLTFVMATGLDSCSEYSAPECTVEVDGSSIHVHVSVAYEDRVGVDSSELSGCSLVRGPEVVAHCDVGTLSPGTYQVEADGFMSEIEVR